MQMGEFYFKPKQVAVSAGKVRITESNVGKAPHEGPIDFAQRAARDLPDAAENVLALSHRYARQRYARPNPGTDDAENLCADLRHFRVPRIRQKTQRSAP